MCDGGHAGANYPTSLSVFSLEIKYLMATRKRKHMKASVMETEKTSQPLECSWPKMVTFVMKQLATIAAPNVCR